MGGRPLGRKGRGLLGDVGIHIVPDAVVVGIGAREARTVGDEVRGSNRWREGGMSAR